MSNDKTNISLELLLLNDLLRTNAIDENIYNLASKKIISDNEENFMNNDNPITLATA